MWRITFLSFWIYRGIFERNSETVRFVSKTWVPRQNHGTWQVCFKGLCIANGSSEPVIHIFYSSNPAFSKIANKIFQMHLNILLKLWPIFCCHQQKIQKWAIFDILMTVTLVGNMISRQMAFFIYSLSSISWYISFLHFKSFKMQFHEVPNDIMHCSVKDL